MQKSPPPFIKSIPSRNLKKLRPELLDSALLTRLAELPPLMSHPPLNFITCSVPTGVVMGPCPTNVTEAERS